MEAKNVYSALDAFQNHPSSKITKITVVLQPFIELIGRHVFIIHTQNFTALIDNSLGLEKRKNVFIRRFRIMNSKDMPATS